MRTLPFIMHFADHDLVWDVPMPEDGLRHQLSVEYYQGRASLQVDGGPSQDLGEPRRVPRQDRSMDHVSHDEPGGRVAPS
jgi:hypothetical protein